MRFLPALPLVLCLTLAACATTAPVAEAPDNFSSATFQAPPRSALIVLLPTQESQYDDLRIGTEKALKQVQRQLGAAGYSVILLDKELYAKQWKLETEAVGGVYDLASGELKEKEYLQALNSLVRKSCSETKCALMLGHRLVLRAAELKNAYLEWDGQRQLAPAGAEASGNNYGISVEVSAITADGELAFKRYGGITPPTEYKLADISKRVRKNTFDDDSEVALGVSIALKPLLIKVPPSKIVPPPSSAVQQ